VDDHRDRSTLVGARPDLANRTQIHHAVTAFYREIVFDEVLEPMFSEVAEVDWTVHIPVLIDYWCQILLGAPGARTSTAAVHRHLHGRRAIEPIHCDRWYSLWVTTLDDGWAGPRTQRAKDHAAVLMAGMARRIFGFSWAPPAAA
jgi:hemoglobin